MKPLFYFRDYKPGDFPMFLNLWQEIGLGDAKRGDNEIVILNAVKTEGEFMIMFEPHSEQLIGVC